MADQHAPHTQEGDGAGMTSRAGPSGLPSGNGAGLNQRVAGEKRPADDGDSWRQPAEKRPKRTYVPRQCKETGHFHVVLGEDIPGTPEPGRWKILDLVGEGTFAKVIEAWDRKRRTLVAVKLVRSIPKYIRDAKYEINMLHKIRDDDVKDFYPLIKYRSYFFCKGPPPERAEHLAIVFPKLGFSLLHYLERLKPFEPKDVAHIAWQMGSALNYLHSNLKHVHTDLKPENILLEKPCEHIDKIGNRTYTPVETKIRIIDFGGCTDEKHSKFSVVSTRHYRAPEVILGQLWMYGADVWSTGCILYELLTGRLLYDTHENREHLAMMQATLGTMPDWYPSVIQQAESRRYFDSRGALDMRWIHEHNEHTHKAREKLFRINKDIGPLNKTTYLGTSFSDLICRCLDYDKTKRLRAYDIMYHPFVLEHWPDAKESNRLREEYEMQCFGEVLGKEGSRKCALEPGYERAGYRL